MFPPPLADFLVHFQKTEKCLESVEMVRKLISKLFKNIDLPLRHVRRKMSADFDGRLSEGSNMCIPGSDDPCRMYILIMSENKKGGRGAGDATFCRFYNFCAFCLQSTTKM